MQTIVENIHGFTVRAEDGDVGNISTLYIDEDTWAVRYLVVDVGNWLASDEVLLAPTSVTDIDFEEEVLFVALSKDQVKNSPKASREKPVSRQYELALHDYYNWQPYWLDAPTYSAGLTAVRTPATLTYKPRSENEVVKPAVNADPHLRSTKELEGYHIHASDGEIGHIEAFLVDTDMWFVRYFVVDTRNWLPGKKVIVAPTWITLIQWADRDVIVDLTQDAIKNSPEFDGPIQIKRDYEQRLYDHYQRAVYWPDHEPVH